MIDWFSTSSHAALSRRQRQPPVPLARDSHLARAERVGRGGRGPARAADRGRRRALPRPAVTLLERATYLSFALPDLVAAIALAYAASHWAARSTAASGCSSSPRRSSSCRSPWSRSAPRSVSSSRRSRTRRARSGAGALASFRRVTLPLARPGTGRRRCARLRVLARRPLDGAGAPPARSLHAREPSSTPTARASPSRPRRRSPPC